MDYRRVGRTGLRVSAICLGTMTFGWSADEVTSHAILDAALAGGINFIDTADIYSYWLPGNRGGESEVIIGSWLKARGSSTRRDVVLATKVRGPMWDGPNGQGLSRQHIMQACEDSLRRLQTDVIDLYQVHYPDNDTPLDETLHALDDLVRQGKVRYIGLSNYPAWGLVHALWTSDANGWARFDCLQPHYSLVNRAEFERELEAACLKFGIGVIPYSPLGAGFLTGKYARGADLPDTTRGEGGLIKRLLGDDKAHDLVDAIRTIATAHERPTAHVALAWLLARPSITAPIIGARTLAQLDEVIGAADLTLTQEEIATLTRLSSQY